jgi:hypothetical protein
MRQLKYFNPNDGRTSFFGEYRGAAAVVALFPDMIVAATPITGYKAAEGRVFFTLSPGQTWNARLREEIRGASCAIKMELSRLLFDSENHMLCKIVYAHGERYISNLEEKLGAAQGGARKGDDKPFHVKTQEEAALDKELNETPSTLKKVNPKQFTESEETAAIEFMKRYFSEKELEGEGAEAGAGVIKWTPDSICSAIIHQAIKYKKLRDEFKYKDVVEYIFHTILEKLGFSELGKYIDKTKYSKPQDTLDVIHDNQLLALTSVVSTLEHNDRIEALTDELDKRFASDNGTDKTGGKGESILASLGSCVRQIEDTFNLIVDRTDDVNIRDGSGKVTAWGLKSQLHSHKLAMMVTHAKALKQREQVKRALSFIQREEHAGREKRLAQRQQFAEQVAGLLSGFKPLMKELLGAAPSPPAVAGFFGGHKDRVDELTDENAQKDQQIAGLQAQVGQLQQENSSLTASNVNKDREMTEASNTIQAKDNCIRTLETRLAYEQTKISAKLNAYKAKREKQAKEAMGENSDNLGSHKIGGIGKFTYGDKKRALDAFEIFDSGRAHILCNENTAEEEARIQGLSKEVIKIEMEKKAIAALANKRLSEIIVPYIRQKLAKLLRDRNELRPFETLGFALNRMIKDRNRVIKDRNKGREEGEAKEGLISGKKAIITLWVEKERAARARKAAERAHRRIHEAPLAEEKRGDGLELVDLRML